MTAGRQSKSTRKHQSIVDAELETDNIKPVKPASRRGDGANSSDEAVQNTEPPRVNAATARTRGRQRTVIKKVQLDAAQAKAIEGLRQKMNAKANTSHSHSDRPTQTAASVTTAASTLASQKAQRNTRSAPNIRNSSPIVEKQATDVDTQPERPRTPTAGQSDDIYGLSPTGKAAQDNAQREIKAKQQSTQKNAPQSSLKAQGTPAVETSILALQKFKRRPRQPSILRMVQQRSDMIDTDLDDLDDLDNFDPDDESTPLNLSKLDGFGGSALSSTPNLAAEPRTSSSRKRKRLDLEEPDVQVMRSSPPIAHDASSRHSPGLSSDTSSLPEVIMDTQEQSLQERHSIEPEIFSETMAPPKSSSPIRGEEEGQNSRTEALHQGSKKSRRAFGKAREDQTNPTRSSRSRQNEDSKLSTAALRALLPRRKWRRNPARADPFEIPTSDTLVDSRNLDSDEDELQQGHRQKRTSHKTPGKKQALDKASKSPSALKKHHPIVKSAAKTYSRRNSDKENWMEGSDSSASDDDDVIIGETKTLVKEADISKSKELEAAAKKFQEIDEWKMEFESVDAGVSGSSPWR